MSRAIVWPAVLAAAVLLAGVAGYWWFNASEPGIDVDRLNRLVTLRAVGLGFLENDRPAESVPAFEEISEQLPEHRLGPRNLAVATLMILGQTDRTRDPQQWQAAAADARTAVQRLQEVDPEAPETYVIAARVEANAGDLARAVDLYERAASLADGAAAAPIWFEIYLATRDAESAELMAAGDRALGNAYRMNPENSTVLLEWLAAQATAQDPAIVDTLEHAKTVLAPLDTSIQERVRVSILDLIEQARAAAADGKWQDVNRLVRMVVNVTRPEEMVQSDRSEVDRSPLEFVVTDFSDEFYDRHDLSRTMAGEPIAVRFLEDTEWQLLASDDGAVLDAIPLDFDLDGSLDIAVLRDGQVTVYARRGTDAWTAIATAALPSGFSSLRGADLDGDATTGGELDEQQPHSADIDLIVSGDAGVAILENRLAADGERTLERIETPEGLQEIAAVQFAGVGDFDQDGDLDLLLSTEAGVNIWSNRGGLRFLAWPAEALQGAEGLRLLDATVVDLDRDVDLDIVAAVASDAAADAGSIGYFENLRHGRMRWRTLAEIDAALDAPTTVQVMDADGNASWDVMAGGPQGFAVALTETPVAGRVVTEAVRSRRDFPAEKLLTFDFDNDGVEDVFAFGGAEAVLLRHLGHGRFLPVQDALPDSVSNVTSAEAGDVDDDGDLDLFIVSDGQMKMLRNHGGNANHWLDVTLLAQQVKGTEAQASGRVNQYGVGSLLELKVGPVYQPRVVRSAVTHFGLGQRKQADVVRVVWTSGIPQNIIEPAGDQLVTERQSLKGSCPYLYTWSGDRFEFVTDLLWSSPLGLQHADGSIARDRPWEWLKVPGEKLQEVDGEYRLQITEELWEAAYFDQVELIAVDHPADVEIFTNEKVGPAELAEPRIHQVTERRLPVSATDASGAEVLEPLAAEDDRYLRPFKKKYRQGYTEPHFLEFDLGPLDDPAEITWFMSGWIYPTDTSINVQLSQDPDHSGPRPPYLMVPDGEGGWRTAREFIGFPGGKTKTIAIDLSDVLTEDDYRFRICTSSEIYWDAVFFTVGRLERPLVEQVLPLRSADLHYRGFSEPVIHEGFGPERFDYSRLRTAPAWPPMSGRFTRYGDVSELLRETDDRLVVLGSGDEMTLRFSAPDQDLPAGWKRDFILHNVGWDKDADLNTIYGQTPEPLPFQAMSAYPVPPSETPPDSPQYRSYLRTYQTRRQADSPFRNWVRSYRPADSVRSPVR